MLLRGLSLRVPSVPRYTAVIRNFCSNIQGPSDGDNKKSSPADWHLGVPKDFEGHNTINEEKQALRPPEPMDPFKRAIKIFKRDILNTPYHLGLRPADDRDEIFSEHVDILIVGGGTIGSAIAFWLKERARDGLRVVVIDKDLTYKNSASAVSVGELHQQFSLEENIQMSLYAAEFLRHSKHQLGEHVNVNYVPSGHLTLATDAQADTLYKNSILQNRLGAKNIVLTARKLKERFPWMNVNGIEIGCLGLENEGWYDPWSLLMGFKHKAQSMGAEYVEAELVNFIYNYSSNMMMVGWEDGAYNFPNEAIVRRSNNEVRKIKFGMCIIAAGAGSPGLQKILRIGKYGKGMRSVPLPLVQRRRHYYVVKMKDGRPIGLNVPQVSDISNLYFRMNGLSDDILVERSSNVLEKYIEEDVPTDDEFFEQHVRQDLESRVPAFKDCEITSGASGFYEYNTFDENGVIGMHPAYHTIFLATGFNGHGLQMAPAVGRAVSEIIMSGEYMTIDMTRLGYDRFFVREPMYDENAVK